MDSPRIIKGDMAVDDRGCLVFANDFQFEGVKRFYIVHNHTRHFVRAWHGHQHEGKYVMAISGACIVAAIPLEQLSNPSRLPPANLFRTILSTQKPAVLWIPPGYANGFMSLTDDASLMYFSTATLDESKNDDLRFDKSIYEQIWTVIER